MYFKNFPNIFYNFDINGNESLLILKDITQNVRVKREILSNITIYDEYDILDEETPEHIAEKFYKNPYYHWIIMLVNDRYDYINDFPMSSYKLERYITDKYGVGNEYNTHHYELNGFVVNSSQSGAHSVTNYDYEASINESKRRIKIVPKQIVDKLVRDLERLI